MKITMFLWNNFTNDARVKREASALTEKNNKVTIIAKRDLNEKHIPCYEKAHSGYVIYREDKWEYKKNMPKSFTKIFKKHIPNALLMLKMIKKGYQIKTDVYHSHDLNTLIQGVICSKIRFRQKKLIFDSHEVNTSRTHYNTRLVKLIEGALIKFTDQTIVENATRAKYHNELYGYYPQPIHNYSEYYDIDEVKAAQLDDIVGQSKKILLYQGGLQEGRGLEMLIDAFSKANVDAVLLFIGDGKIKNKLLKQVDDLNLTHKIKFIGRVPYEQLRSFTKCAYAGFQILQNTNFNHYSASSNKLYEYIMAHVPVIGTNLPEIKSVIERENIGIVIRESNENDLTKAIQTMVNNETLHKVFVEQTKKAKHKYNWNIEKEQLYKVYKNLE